MPRIPPPLRRALLVLAGLLVVLSALIWALLPFDPLEGPAGPLDRMVPADAGTVWRFDGPALLSSSFVQATWEREDVRELREEWCLDARVVAPLRRMERVFADATLGLADPPSLERDLIPAEVLVATRGDDVLLATRISSRARAVELVRALPAERAAELGVRVEGAHLVLGAAGGTPIRVRRHRDVLLAATSRAFLDDAFALAELDDAAPRSAFEEALAMGRPAGPRVFGWVESRALARRLAPSRPEDDAREAPPWWTGLLAANDAAPLEVELGLEDREALTLRVRGAWRDALPQPFAAAAEPGGAPEASLLAERAGGYFVPGETFASGGFAVSAKSALQALLGSQPPERQALLGEALAQAGESVESVARSLAVDLEDGIAYGVARLREADAALGGDDAGAVHAIPATLVVFRTRTDDAGDRLVADLRRRAETLFGAPLGDVVEMLPDGTRLHTLERHGLAGQWELLHPAFAIRGRELVFSTHEGYLRRALAFERGPPGWRRLLPDAPGRAFRSGIDPEPLRRWFEDQGWEAADRATWRDWAAARREIEASMPPGDAASPAERIDAVDAKVRALRRHRAEREIPEAAAAWRERFAWLARFGPSLVDVDVTGRRAELRGRIRLAGR